ncbi:hypothetical protein LX32DRAFT_229021 [Colletotrichum zoysiae]|uniref:Secreted protein n=1 Tax=Colletotrichum zoysiae TaxID=1216348 RepID=A0AAD9LXE8_9PEZI|nr:hypothetical protein LX32DRAFT_229021 [Colletotrichum zoysiae]
MRLGGSIILVFSHLIERCDADVNWPWAPHSGILVIARADVHPKNFERTHCSPAALAIIGRFLKTMTFFGLGTAGQPRTPGR